MKTATITEVKNKLSAFIDRVRAGETIVIMDRGRPVARLEPVASTEEAADGRLARLERAGLVAVGRGRPPVALISRKPPRSSKGASASRELIDERRASP